MFGIRLATLGTSENSAILSMAVTHFDINKDYTFSDLIENTCFVKFSAKEQKHDGRFIDPSTVKWWKDQSTEAKRRSFFPNEDDVTVCNGLEIVSKFINERKEKDDVVFTRGPLFSFCLENLCKQYNIPTIFNSWQYLDFRTTIIILKETSNKYGYCEYDNKVNFNRFDPIHDNCNDILMLLYGK